MDGNEACIQVARKYGALPIACTSKGRLDVSVKSLLYSIGHGIDAERFICLDADMLVLGDITPIFAALDVAPIGSVLVCREGNYQGPNSLAAAIQNEWIDFERERIACDKGVV